MAVRVFAATLLGASAHPVEVEVDLLRRLPSVSIVGLPASAVRESAERVRSAIAASEREFPRKRVVINLAPADIRKEGTAFDLPMALGILAANGDIDPDTLEDILAVGELSLAGALRPIRGALPLALLARDLGRTLILPRSCAAQAALVPDVTVLCADTLVDVLDHLSGTRPLQAATPADATVAPIDADMADVRGQPVARRAIEIAAAGGHHVLFTGPPGCGKTMLSKRFPSILPPMSFDEALDVTRVYSAAGLLDDEQGLLRSRPFRAPHHSVSAAGLIGDRSLRPGEVSLAHHGVLFLDEATEFPRSVLDVLREPVEEGRVRLTRASGTVEYPAEMMLVMAANPCPCGRRGTSAACTCTDNDVQRYQRRLSGPLLDRIDLHVPLQPVGAEDLLSKVKGESSSAVRQRVVAARTRQTQRGQGCTNGRLAVHQLSQPTGQARTLMLQAMQLHGMSGRGVHRILRVARTIADLASSETVEPIHLAEALGFRTQDVTA
ncbi:MAG: magnesium chelatase family protein [Myxococcota bacterium]|jgi:magnesium chelatase family protein